MPDIGSLCIKTTKIDPDAQGRGEIYNSEEGQANQVDKDCVQGSGSRVTTRSGREPENVISPMSGEGGILELMGRKRDN